MKLSRMNLNREELVVEESLFHTANGYLGVRGNFEEGYPDTINTIRGCYINGYYDEVEIPYGEKLYGFPEKGQRIVNLPDIQSMDLFLDDEKFSLFTGTIENYYRELDTETGTAKRSAIWVSEKGHKIELNITRMVSFKHPELFLTVYSVKNLGESALVEVKSELDCVVSNFADPNDPRIAAEKIQHIFADEIIADEFGGTATCHTGKAKLGVAICQMFEAHIDDTESLKPVTSCDTNHLYVEVKNQLLPGQTLSVKKYTTLSDSRRKSSPLSNAKKVMKECKALGVDFLLKEQQEWLKNFWDGSGVSIDSNDGAQEQLEYSLYGLVQSAGQDGISNIPAKGLSGEGYEGHYFWDTEIYMFPFFLYTQPEMAKKLLEYRYSILPQAKQHAKLLGHSQGALYAWRTISGTECSSYYPSGSAQYHISSDVAYSFSQYYSVTQDDLFMVEKGLEVLLETSRLWCAVGSYNSEGYFCINDVTGPDEYTCIVNNNYYTNSAAKNNLLKTIEIWDSLCEKGYEKNMQHLKVTTQELETFKKCATDMYLPFNSQLGISEQDDSFLNKPIWDFARTPTENYPLLLHYHPLFLYRHQVCKQADTVLAHYLFGEDVPEEIIERSYLYYEKITTHDSSLSKCVFSIMAAQIGDIEKAFAYYRNSLRTDLENCGGNTKDGIHTANMGGAYLGLVAGFAGLRVQNNQLFFNFTLPQQWNGYSFAIRWRESKIKIKVIRQKVEILLLEGPGIEVYIDKHKYRVDDFLVLNLKRNG